MSICSGPFRVVIFLWVLLLASCSSITVNESNKNSLAEINLKLGLLYLEQGQIPLAKSKLFLASKHSPNDPKTQDALGYFFAHTGELNVAAKYYQHAIKWAREKGLFWHNYGKFFYQQKKYTQALTYFLLAAKDIKYLYTAWAYYDASKTAFKLQKKDLADHYYREAMLHGFTL